MSYVEWKTSSYSVSLGSEDEKYLYFTADLPGFSSFAITGKANLFPEEGIDEIGSEQETGSIEEKGMESTGSKFGERAEQEEIIRAPGFEIASGIACLLACLLACSIPV